MASMQATAGDPASRLDGLRREADRDRIGPPPRDASIDDAQASDAQASDAQASDAQASDAQASDAQGLDAQALNALAFDHVISLGSNCEAAHQLRIAGCLTRSLFDWLVTPLDAIPRILADDGRRLGREFVVCHSGTSVRCGAYDVLYHHEFPRGNGDVVCFSIEAVERCRSKLAHKCERFIEACEDGGRVLFLRFEARTDLAWDSLGEEEGDAAAAVSACAAAIAGRFPDLDFRLLLISTRSEAARWSFADPRIAVATLPRAEAEGWAVSDEDWDALLTSLRLSRPRRGDDAGETLF